MFKNLHCSKDNFFNNLKKLNSYRFLNSYYLKLYEARRKNLLGGQILYTSLPLLKKRRHCSRTTDLCRCGGTWSPDENFDKKLTNLDWGDGHQIWGKTHAGDWTVEWADMIGSNFKQIQ